MRYLHELKEGHVEYGGKPQRSGQGQDDADQAAEGGEDHRLNQELGEELI